MRSCVSFCLTTISFLILVIQNAISQSYLPPAIEWKGKSELLIVKKDNPWITPAEKSDFTSTPAYDETMSWLKRLSDASPLLTMIPIGTSPEGRKIYMIIASKEKNVDAASLNNSAKPLLFVQAGIHAGEIDGKDAGMMLLRDIAFGEKKNLLDDVNLLFIPILNVDGHERSSPYNRPNQRGPQNMGWRTNAQNLNLNRDYAKLDTKELTAVINVINEYDPLLYMDIHVTDGADYQYDITFGGFSDQGYSPAINEWLEKKYKPNADKDLKSNGHIPGQLIFASNDRDFSQGTTLVRGEPRFSNSYGDLRHLASVLVENHSLKPFKERVLGTYVLLESTMKYLSLEGKSLREITKSDRARRDERIPTAWRVPNGRIDSVTATNGHDVKNQSFPKNERMDFLGIDSRILKSEVTNSEYAEWLGKPVTMKIDDIKGTEPYGWITRPKGYWVPASKYEIIERLKTHGINMEILTEPREVNVEMYRMDGIKYLRGNDRGIPQPYEGHITVTSGFKTENRKEMYAAGSAYISTDQPLGDLAMILLEPDSPDSYFSWGFFLEIFQRTEYIEAYVMEPMMKKMLENSTELKKEFEQKKIQDTSFANNPTEIYSWFYSKTKFYDEKYLLYPVGRAMN